MSIQTEITRISRSGISNEAASELLPQEYFLVEILMSALLSDARPEVI